MQNSVFMEDKLIIVLIELLVLGCLIFLINYLREKAKNLATKEDICGITKEVESVKTHYASQLHVSQIRYEKEFQILSDLSEKLVELRDAALSLRPTVDFVPQDEKEERQKRLIRFHEANRALYLVSEAKRPFYPEQVYRVLNEFSRIAWSEAVGYKNREFSHPIKYWEEAQKNAEAISTLANKTLDAIRDRIKTWEHIDVQKVD